MPEVYLRNPLAHLLGSAVGFIRVARFPWVIGRDPSCDLTFEVPPVSRFHCKLVLRDDEVWVQDLESRNGTTLNGLPVGRGVPLRDQDHLVVACVPLEVRILEPEQVKQPAFPPSKSSSCP